MTLASAPAQLCKYIILREGKIVLSAECFNEPFPLKWFIREYGEALKPGDELYTRVKHEPL